MRAARLLVALTTPLGSNQQPELICKQWVTRSGLYHILCKGEGSFVNQNKFLYHTRVSQRITKVIFRKVTELFIILQRRGWILTLLYVSLPVIWFPSSTRPRCGCGPLPSNGHYITRNCLLLSVQAKQTKRHICIKETWWNYIASLSFLPIRVCNVWESTCWNRNVL